MDAKTRFEKYVSPEPNTGCWLWSGGYAGNGYPMFSFEGKAVKASRFAYTQEKGQIEEGRYMRHLCHNPSCVNPDHLEQGTQKDNIQDSLYDGRLNKKMTNEEVLAVLSEYDPYVVSLSFLADKYEVSKRNILDIVKGKKFRHLYKQHLESVQHG